VALLLPREFDATGGRFPLRASCNSADKRAAVDGYLKYKALTGPQARELPTTRPALRPAPVLPRPHRNHPRHL
jgi:hypothetical protein